VTICQQAGATEEDYRAVPFRTGSAPRPLRAQTMLQIGSYLSQSPEIFGPYKRLDQKNTPFWRPW
jgi:hypothetical protein